MNNTIRLTLSNIFTVLCDVIIVIGIVSLIAVAFGIRPFVMISESMHPEVTKGSLVLLDISSKLDDVAVGDNVAYRLGKVVAMHKVMWRTEDELTVRSIVDDGETVVTAFTYMGKQVLNIPQIGGWIRKMLDYEWIGIVAAAGLIVAGCVPKKKIEN